MDQAFESEWLEEVQEDQEVEGFSREEERQMTILGQDPLYNHLIWQWVSTTV